MRRELKNLQVLDYGGPEREEQQNTKEDLKREAEMQ
jgi:hypothetical protein